MTTPRYVKQKDKTGCGYACVAMLTNPPQSYEKIKRAHVGRRTTGLHTDNKEIKILLKEHGVEYEGRFRSVRGRAWSEISYLALVGCGFTKRTGNWHWIIFDGRSGLLYDPLSARHKPFQPDGRNRKPFIALKIVR